MKTKELKETKRASKNTSNAEGKRQKARKPGSGGKRPGSGRNPAKWPVKQYPLNMPVIFVKIMREKGLKNKNGYINNLIANDLLLNKGIGEEKQAKQLLIIKNETAKFNVQKISKK